MSGCCDDNITHPLELIPAGLELLPRQLAGFPEIRQRLLERLTDTAHPARQSALGSWRPYSDDFGSMSLEMWAYVADILGFYDERVANESYLGTAVRRPSLRRLVGLLGHTPIAGMGGSATLAAIADGTVAIKVPFATGVRSGSFNGNPAQVFETAQDAFIHPLLNTFTVEPFRLRPTVDASFFVGDTSAPDADKKSGKPGSGQNRVNRILFLPEGFGLVEAAPCLIEARPGEVFDEQVTRMTKIEPFGGRDGKSYSRAMMHPAIVIAEELDLSTLRARRPTRQVRSTVNEPIDSGKTAISALSNTSAQTRLFVDGSPAPFRLNDPVIAVLDEDGDEAGYHFARIVKIIPSAATVTSIPPGTFTDAENRTVALPTPKIVVTDLRLEPALPPDFLEPERVRFHHGFVEAGQPTNVCRMSVSAQDLSASEGVPLAGTVRLPADTQALAAQITAAASGDTTVLEQRFLLSDSEMRGALINARVTVAQDGTARFQALDASQIPDQNYQLPLTVYGNLLDVTRGESVRAEVLGSGDRSQANQRFKLRKKQLTYLPGTVNGSGALADSTLSIRVDGIEWRQVPGFFGCGRNDQVYTVHHDDQQNTFVTFGDEVRGARLTSGVENIVADYRFGAGAPAPPANGIRQLAGAVKGLRAIRSPVAAAPGRDPDTSDDLRSSAPNTALLLGRAVSAVDFAALTRNAPGVLCANANWLWIPEQFQAGVVVHYIGDADPATVNSLLRSQADPTLPIAVTQASPITVQLDLTVEVDPRAIPADVAAAVLSHLLGGLLNLTQAVIGGTFWITHLYEAVHQVPFATSVAAVSFSGLEPALLPKSVGGSCVPTGRYYDFSGPGAITVTGVPATALPGSNAKGDST